MPNFFPSADRKVERIDATGLAVKKSSTWRQRESTTGSSIGSDSDGSGRLAGEDMIPALTAAEAVNVKRQGSTSELIRPCDRSQEDAMSHQFLFEGLDPYKDWLTRRTQFGEKSSAQPGGGYAKTRSVMGAFKKATRTSY